MFNLFIILIYFILFYFKRKLIFFVQKHFIDIHIRTLTFYNLIQNVPKKSNNLCQLYDILFIYTTSYHLTSVFHMSSYVKCEITTNIFIVFVVFMINTSCWILALPFACINCETQIHIFTYVVLVTLVLLWKYLRFQLLMNRKLDQKQIKGNNMKKKTN